MEILENYIVRGVTVKEIYSDESFNCRGEKIIPFDVQDLAEDIAKHGLTQPIVVQPWKEGKKFKYRVVVGHRRLQAFKNLRKETIPAIVREDLDETQARILNLSENIKRKDLNVYQEAKALEHFLLRGWSREQIAEALDVSTGWVQIRATVLQLPFEVQREVAAGYFTQTQIKDLYALKNRDKIFEAVRHIKDQKIKNEKRAVVIKKPIKKKDPEKRKIQSPESMIQLLDYLMDTLGPSLTTRVIAWATGNISTQELLDDIQEECQLKGVKFQKPDWVE